jgi:AI-2 transport system substrate-binding protein
MLVEMASKSLLKRGKDPTAAPIKYAWHYSQSSTSDQNSWREAGEAYIREAYPNWTNVKPENYYSRQDPQLALAMGRKVLAEHPDIDVVICNDSTSLPGQAQALQEAGLTAQDVTVTGFATPKAMREFAKAGVIDRWGLWDCQLQAALVCHLAYRLASGETIKVGQVFHAPDIGLVEVMPNTVLDPQAWSSPNSGVVLLPRRLEFTAKNVDNYDY